MLFISHSTQDKSEALKLYVFLRAQGYNREQLFLDSHPESGFSPGEKYKRVLYDSINKCAAMIVQWSSHWDESRWCFAELMYAETVYKPIFPVALHEGKLPDGLRESHAIFPYKDTKAYEKLLESLKKRHMGPEDLPSKDGRLSVNSRRYKRILQQLRVEDKEIWPHPPIALVLGKHPRLAFHLLRWASSNSLPPIKDFDDMVAGVDTTQARLRLEDTKRSAKEHLEQLGLRCEDIGGRKWNLERRILKIEQEFPPRKPPEFTSTNTYEIPSVSTKHIAQQYQQDVREYMSEMRRYEEETEKYKERQKSLAGLKDQLESIHQQSADIELQISKFKAELKPKLATLEDAVEMARGRDILSFFATVRDAVKNAMYDKGATVASFYTMLAVQVSFPLLRPLLRESSSLAYKIVEGIEQSLEELTKTMHLVVGEDFLRRWLSVRKALLLNGKELAEIKEILGSLPVESLTKNIARAQDLMSKKLPQMPNILNLSDLVVWSQRVTVLDDLQLEVEQQKKACQDFVKETASLYERTITAKEQAEHHRSRIKSVAENAVNIHNEVNLLTAMMTSALAASLPEHTKAFVVSMLGEVERRLDKNQLQFTAYCQSSNFLYIQAEQFQISHPSEKFIESKKMFTSHIFKISEHLKQLDTAKSMIGTISQRIRDELIPRMRLLNMLSYVPMFQIYSALQYFYDKRFETVIKSKNPNITPLRKTIMNKVHQAAIITTVICGVIFAYLAYSFEEFLKYGHGNYIDFFIAIGISSFLSAYILWSTWGRFRSIIKS